MAFSKKPPSFQKGSRFLKSKKKGEKKSSKAHQSPTHSKTKRKLSKSRLNSGWGRFLRWFFLFLLWGGLILTAVVGYFSYDLPSLESLKPGMRRPSLTFKSFDGEVLCAYGDSQEKLYDLKEISPSLLKAVIAIEDRRFYFHKGVDIFGIIRAAWINFRHKAFVQGGSTLTQQLAKNLFLTPQRSLKRKIQEMILALWLEHTFTKDQILSIYLNRVYLGAGLYGVGAASQKYFKKSPSHLSLYESALLAGLLKAPSFYNPLQNPKRAYKRAAIVLDAMVEEGMITPWEKTETFVSTLISQQQDLKIEGIRYFCDWLIKELPKYIGDFNVQDLVITTTLDPKLQGCADKSIEETLRSSKDYDGLQVAMISMSRDGAVRAMIGGRSYEKSPFNRAYQALRQPGSLFKMVVFLSALEAGKKSGDLISDEAIRIGKWAPKNHEWSARGMISLKDAFAYSVNTAAVRLAREVGLSAIQKTSQKLGIKSQISNNLSVALGTSEVSLLEIVSAFAVIANKGYAVEPYGIIRIETKKGRVLYERRFQQPLSVISISVADHMQDMLRSVITYGRGKKANLPEVWVAGKTGTTQEKQDAWFVGFTPHLVTGVWVGIDNKNSAKIKKKKRPMGGGLPTKLFRNFMESLQNKR